MSIAEQADNYSFTGAVQQGEEGVASLLDKMVPQFKRALPEHLEADRLARLALTEIRRTPKLLKCSQVSLLGALMKAAQIGLEPGVLGHCHLVPFKGEVELVIGYRGLVDLARRSGRLLDIQAVAIYEGDTFRHAHGGDKSFHYEKELREDRGDVYAFGAYARLQSGGLEFVVLRKDEVEARRKQIGKSAYYDSSPWVSHFDQMAKKTCIRELSKMLPMSTDYRRAEAADGGVFHIGDSQGEVIDVEPDQEAKGVEDLKQATGENLDAMGEAFNNPRREGESDADYRERVLKDNRKRLEPGEPPATLAQEMRESIEREQQADKVQADRPQGFEGQEHDERRERVQAEVEDDGGGDTITAPDGRELPDTRANRLLVKKEKRDLEREQQQALRVEELASKVRTFIENADVSDQEREQARYLLEEADLDKSLPKAGDQEALEERAATVATSLLEEAEALAAEDLERHRAEILERAGANVRAVLQAAPPEAVKAALELLTEEEAQRWAQEFPEDAEQGAKMFGKWAVENAEPPQEDAEQGEDRDVQYTRIDNLARQEIEEWLDSHSEEDLEAALELVTLGNIERFSDKFEDPEKAAAALAGFAVEEALEDVDQADAQEDADPVEQMLEHCDKTIHWAPEFPSSDKASRERAKKAARNCSREDLERWLEQWGDAETAGSELADKAINEVLKAQLREQQADDEPSEIRQELDIMDKPAQALERAGLGNLDDLVEAMRVQGPDGLRQNVKGLGPATVNTLHRKMVDRGLLEYPDSDVDNERAKKIRQATRAKIKDSGGIREAQLANLALGNVKDSHLWKFEGEVAEVADKMADELLRHARRKLKEDKEAVAAQSAAKSARAAQRAQQPRTGDKSQEDGEQAALPTNPTDYSEDPDWQSLRQSMASSIGHAQLDDEGTKPTETERDQFYEAVCKRNGVEALVELEPNAFEEEVEKLKGYKTKSAGGGLSPRAAYMRRTINEELDL